jgi:hypothetical protein
MRQMPSTAVLQIAPAPGASAYVGVQAYAHRGFAATKNVQDTPQSRGTPG